MSASTSFFKQSGTSATLQTTFNQTVADAQAAQAAAEAARDLANQYKTAAENARDTANTHAGNAQTSAGTALTHKDGAEDFKDDAEKIASTAHNTQYTLSDSSTGYSSLHYSTESANSATTASGHATTALGHSNTASGHADDAEDWAVKVDGIVDGDYSSKAHAIGGTGVTSQTGPAKDWAIATGTVDSSGEFSAKKYAIGDMTTGSAKQWALGGGSGFATNTTVDGTYYSAKYYAEQAASSASDASGSLTQFQEVWLGSGTSDPSSGHTAGDLFFRTDLAKLRYFDGTNWESLEPGVTAGSAIAFAIAL